MIKCMFVADSAKALRSELLVLLGLESPTHPVMCQEKPEALPPATGETGDSFSECLSETSDKKTRKRRTKAEIAADEAAAKAVSTPEPEPTAPEEPEPAAEPLAEVKPPETPKDTPAVITDKIVKAACLEVADLLGTPDPVYAVLAQFGVKSVADMKEADLPKAYAKIKALAAPEKEGF